MSAVSTEWATRLGLRAPIVCAPMGGVAGGRLASAVSRAGALGTIGMGSAGSAEALERELALLDTGGAPFGIGLVGWSLDRDPAMLSLARDAGPALVSVSFLDWSAPMRPAWIAAVQSAGALAVTQVSTAAEARHAAEAGVDAVVARGREGGGHGDHREPRRELLAEVLAAVDLPVLSAGAVSAANGVAEAIAQGAAAAWVGTAFSACPEALTSDAARAVLLAADGSETLVSRVLDVALERPWPARFPERLLRTPFVDRWQGREDQLAGDPETRAAFRAAFESDDFSIVPIDAGQGVGLLTEARPAAEVVAALVSGPATI
ncbi:MAG: nitronate monooxygenase [Candidatus Leucobacter sulfamidivorax]|nr:nitronate monooxygenase [Candidatus Leucobacter sulfamidivorax]